MDRSRKNFARLEAKIYSSHDRRELSDVVVVSTVASRDTCVRALVAHSCASDEIPSKSTEKPTEIWMYVVLCAQADQAALIRRVFSHIGNRNLHKKPLVVAFVGPSGHGKTELAIRMGGLLSVKHAVIDCAQLYDRMDLLGASNEYLRSDEGFSAKQLSRR